MLNKEEEKKDKGGLYNQLKNNKPEPITKYTKEHLISVFKEVFSKVDNNPDRVVKMPLFWKHNVWEENGKQYSSWTYGTGLFNLITTGDKGKEEFDKLMAEQFKETPNLFNPPKEDPDNNKPGLGHWNQE